jgi:hypothetical protein
MVATTGQILKQDSGINIIHKGMGQTGQQLLKSM